MSFDTGGFNSNYVNLSWEHYASEGRINYLKGISKSSIRRIDIRKIFGFDKEAKIQAYKPDNHIV